jgi:hypothetical protein
MLNAGCGMPKGVNDEWGLSTRRGLGRHTLQRRHSNIPAFVIGPFGIQHSAFSIDRALVKAEWSMPNAECSMPKGVNDKWEMTNGERRPNSNNRAAPDVCLRHAG